MSRTGEIQLSAINVMASLWCRTTLDEAHCYYQRARQAAWANWAIERMEDWSPSEEEFAGWVQEMWLSGCKLLMSAQLAQRWVRVADAKVPEIPGLRVARNSIEHLFEAEFDARHIVSSSRVGDDGKLLGAWDIDKLPERQLLIGLGKDPLNMVFDAVPLRGIADFAYDHAHRDGDVPLEDSAFLVSPPTDFLSRCSEDCMEANTALCTIRDSGAGRAKCEICKRLSLRGLPATLRGSNVRRQGRARSLRSDLPRTQSPRRA